MKKIKKVLIALVLAIVMVFGVAGCNAGAHNELQSTIENLQSQIAEMEDRLAEMEDQLRERDTTIEDLNEQIKKQDEKIEELEKELAEKTVGAFYSLQEAYDNGFLSYDELQSIAYYHQSQFINPDFGMSFNADLMGDNYQPIPKTSENLSTLLNLAIKQTMVNDLNKRFDTDSFALDNIVIYEYCGTYNDCVAIRMLYSAGPDFAVNDITCEHTVANVTFFYPDYTSFYYLTSYIFSNTIMIWKENS